MAENGENEARSGIETAVAVGCLLNIALHVWTVVLAYQIKGFWPMVLTLVLPGLSEFYWAFTLWDTMRYYSIIVVTFTVIFGALKGVANVLKANKAE